MPIHPDTINAAGLRRRWRGYDRRQVEALLHRVGQDYSAALDTIAELGDNREPSGREPGAPATSLAVTDTATPAATRQPDPVPPAADTDRPRPPEQQPPDAGGTAGWRDGQNTRRASSGGHSPPPHREPAADHLGPAGTAAQERIEQIEAELSRLRARLSLIERIYQLEDELKGLRAAAAAPPDAPTP